MKYLILSDIHGSLQRLQRALSFYEEQHCDMLCILGDILNYGPRNGLPEDLNPQAIAATLNAMSGHIIAIRGNCDSEVDQMLLQFPMLADYTLIVDEGKKLFLTHGHRYNRQQLPPGEMDVVFTGHTHLWELEREGHTVFCNSGSITFPKKGNPPTLVIYQHGRISVYDLNGTLLKELSL
ncbi:MAG: phosphodiesterase [Prevotellaceae bacterium]|nr:phosphodiesterase [Prevotellaceae bacterium]